MYTGGSETDDIVELGEEVDEKGNYDDVTIEKPVSVLCNRHPICQHVDPGSSDEYL